MHPVKYNAWVEYFTHVSTSLGLTRVEFDRFTQNPETGALQVVFRSGPELQNEVTWDTFPRVDSFEGSVPFFQGTELFGPDFDNGTTLYHFAP